MKLNALKFLLLLSICLIQPLSASAQFSLRSIGGTAWFGVQGGISYAGESISSLPDNASTSMTTGAIGGLSFEYWLDNAWAVGAGVLYTQKGINELYAPNARNRDTNNVIYSGSDNFSMGYLEIPILIRYSMGLGDVRPYICAGPSIGMLLQSSESVSGSVAPISDLKSDLQSTDLSLYAALGIMDAIPNGPILFFEAGFAVGLSNIYKSTPERFATSGISFPEPIDPTGAKTGDIRVTIGAMWPL